MTINELEIRRRIVRLTIGQSATIDTAPDTHAAVERCALAFGKAKKIPLVVRSVKDGLVVTRVEPSEKVSLYPEIDRLEVGQSHVFPLPPGMHQRVRMAATSRNRTGKMRLTCAREGDQIRVTRLPVTEDEAQTCGPIQAPATRSKYALERLSTEPMLTFHLNPSDHQRLRMAATAKGKQTGWKIRCRLQDDGSMLVYRVDPGSPRAEATEAAA